MSRVNWKRRTATEIANLVKDHYMRMSKDSLRDVVGSMINLVEMEEVGVDLKLSILSLINENDELRQKIDELEQKLRNSNNSFKCYLRADRKKIINMISELE